MVKLFRNLRQKPVFYLILFLGLLFVVFNFRGSIKTARTGSNDLVGGWAWSENIGWISFNCSNPEIDSCATQDYGVDLDIDMNLSGYAWSENVGWIAFEDTVATPDGHAFASNCINDCNVDFGNTCIACFNPDDWEVYGWAKIVALGDDGWISLNCANQDACNAGPPSDWYDTDWDYRKKVTINASQVASTESDFSVLIARNSDSDVANSARADGYDIMFTDSTGTSTLDFEREYYNSSTGEMYFWVEMDISSAADTDIYMYYGNASQSTDLSSPNDVWDNNYQAVYHLSEEGNSDSGGYGDSTINGRDATGVSMTGTSDVTGKMYKAQNFDGSDDYLTFPYDFTASQDEVTISMWVDLDEDVDTNTIYDAYYDTNRWQFSVRHDEWYTRDSAYDESRDNDLAWSAPSTVGWHYLVIRYSVSEEIKHIYVDGVENASTAVGVTTLTSERDDERLAYASDGSNYDGQIDEVRISNTARSKGWIQNEYNNQNDPSSFLTFDSEEEQPSGGGINYHIYVTNDGEFHGWGWNNNNSDTGIGWTSFNCLDTDSCAASSYSVKLTSVYFPEVINLSAPNHSTSTACDGLALDAYLRWGIYDPDPGADQQYYHVIVSTNSTSSGVIYDSLKTETSQKQCNITASDGLDYGTPYYWWVKVWDNLGFPSIWVQFDTDIDTPSSTHVLTDNQAENFDSKTFTTFKHEFPDVDFNYVPTEVMKDEIATFTAISIYYAIATGPDTPIACDDDNCSYYWRGGGTKSIGSPYASITTMTFKYSLDPSATSTYANLRVTDNDNYYCSSSTSMFIDLLPQWKEIKPTTTNP